MSDARKIMETLMPVISDKSCIIFDMDGTIIDSMPIWEKLDVEYMKSIGHEIDEDFHDEMRKKTIPTAAEYIHRVYKTKQTPEEIEAGFIELADRYYREEIPLKPGAYELIEALYNEGYKLAIATANDINMCEAALKRLGVDKFFRCIVNCDMAGASKEKPDVYDLACSRLGSFIEMCVVFEDSLHAINTAKSAGYTVVGVYEEAVKEDWEEISRITDCQVVFE